MSGSSTSAVPESDLSLVGGMLIVLRHQGVSWEACAVTLGRSVAALNIIARRLRDRGEWKLVGGKPAHGAPRAGKRGRPRNIIPSAPVSLRFSPDVAAALRTVARCAGKREGEVVAEAMQRALDRLDLIPVSETPLGLDPGTPYKLCDGLRTETVAVNVPQPVFDKLCTELDPYELEYPMSLIADAVHRLLHDLNYRLVDCSGSDT